MIREAVFARQGWYPLDEAEARKALKSFLKSDNPPRPAVAAIAPHAGWVFSGPAAGRLYAELEIPERVVLLCPTHRSPGPLAALYDRGAWETPLGPMEVDEPFAEKLAENSPLVTRDPSAHRDEHSIEIQLPFLKARNPNAKIVPIRLMHPGPAEIARLAEDLAATIREAHGETLIVASSDMSHEDDLHRLQENDRLAREKIKDFDAFGLMETVAAHGITMCGYLPAALAMQAAKHLGAVKAAEVAYTNSAEVSGRSDYVVGYLAARFDRED